MDSTTAPTEILPAPVVPAAGENCRACAATLSPDQRYCVECGERRGEPRLPFMTGRPEPALPPPPEPAHRARRPMSTASTTLIAGIGTLLLAMGVGVLIGRSGDAGQNAKAAPAQVVTLSGAAGAATASTSTPAAVAAGAGTATAAKKGKGAKAAKAAASTPKSGTTVAKKKGTVVKLGQKGHGPGYKNGQFTGDFFGP